ncbi:Beta-fructofuranosidase, insoluble isoenzyme CWINV6 [Glycine max]|nr:Beta-fructofuranosidase, insoluble isoenzyme CWINV6 [Glycine max]
MEINASPHSINSVKHTVRGHSVSYDLINWIHLNHALEPSESYDINDCYSGLITTLPGEKPVIMYTGNDTNKHQIQNLAMPKNLSDPCLRDITIAWQGVDGKWGVNIGAKNGDDGKALLYHSEDFVNWKLHPNHASDNTGIFFPVYISGSKSGVDTSVQNSSVKHVLEMSYQNKQLEYNFLGEYFPDQEKFTPDADDLEGTNLNLLLDHGMFYASKSFFNYAKNRRILWGWSKECESTQDDYEKGWAGLQSIPRQVWLHKSGKWLMQWPIEEVEKLRDKQVSIMREKLVGESTIEVSGIPASQDLDKTLYGTIFGIDPNVKTISLRSLIDRSIIESFGEKGRICITSRVYPSLVIDKDAHLYVFSNGSQSAVIFELNAWSMKQAEFGQEESII